MPPRYAWLRDFVDSMPQSYRDRHDARAMTDHARLAARRRGRAVAGAFRCSQPGLPLCVVATDRPGLLSTISAALVLSRLDVLAAEAWGRTTAAGDSEAVDLFWVRDATEPDQSVWGGPEQIARFHSLLVVMLDGTFDRASLARSFRRGTRAGLGDTRVRFVLTAEGTLSGIDVETQDRPGLLFALTSALFAQRLEITRSEVRTVGNRVFDRFYFRELDGAPVDAERESGIEREVLSALRPDSAALAALDASTP